MFSLTNCDYITMVKEKNDLMSVFMEIMRSIPLKSAFFIFILFIIVTSDIFVKKILGKLSGTTEQDMFCVTGKGAFIQGLILSLGFIGVHMLIENEVL